MINIDKGSVKFGTSFVEGVKQTLGQTYEAVKEAVPIVGQVEEFYAGSEEREKARLLERGFTPEQIQAANVEKQQYTKTGEATSQFIQDVSDVTNIAPELIQAGAFVAESVLDARMAGRMTLDTSRGFARLMPAEPVQALTITDQPILEAVGVKPGQKNIVTPQQGKRLIRRDAEIDRLKGSIQRSNEQLDALLELKGDPDNLRIFIDDNPEVKQLMGMYEGRPNQIEKVANRLRERRIGAQESLSRQQSNVLPFDESDPNFFRSKEGLAAKKDEEIKRNITGYLEQHHLFPKGISAAFFGKMDDLISKGKADKDDLIVMAEYAVKQGKRTGDVKSNLINMQKDPHNELHTMLRASGAELGKTDYVRSLKDVKDVNELMRRWRDMLDADVAYNVDTAKVWEPLDDLIKEVRASK